MCSMTGSDMPIIDSKTVRQQIKGNSIRLVDVRREQEYQQGHITNAINLPSNPSTGLTITLAPFSFTFFTSSNISLTSKQK